MDFSALVLLSAHVERFSVSPMRDFWLKKQDVLINVNMVIERLASNIGYIVYMKILLRLDMERAKLYKYFFFFSDHLVNRVSHSILKII